MCREVKMLVVWGADFKKLGGNCKITGQMGQTGIRAEMIKNSVVPHLIETHSCMCLSFLTCNLFCAGNPFPKICLGSSASLSACRS